MKIAQLCSVYRSVNSHSPFGVHHFIGNLADSLAQQHDVTVFAAGDSVTRAKLQSVTETNAAFRNASDTEIMRENLETASLCYRQAKKFDIIHDHFMLVGCHFSPLVSTPTVHSIHMPVTAELRKHLLQYKKEKFISFSHAQRKQFPELNWVANIYHGIDTNIYTFQETSDEYVLYLGRITEDKGVHHAIAAAKAANVQILIAGISNSDEGYWRKEIEPHIDGNQVRFIGHANLEQKVFLMQNAKALLFPTLAEETFGLVMIEAMSCGTPVIAFDRGAIQEVIQDKETGFIVNTEKQMVAAIKKVDTLSRFAARKRVETFFSIERMTRGYERVYQRYVK
ncbi:MAG: glycosyltransferase family 4 protein [Candidatus Uhrbacteria bacterium]|nr:glycosyltransferase family 4 protein [Candidatus Uhrbacteria bacterium]